MNIPKYWSKATADSIDQRGERFEISSWPHRTKVRATPGPAPSRLPNKRWPQFSAIGGQIIIGMLAVPSEKK